MEAELARGAEGVHWAALRARACLLMGAPFDEEARKPNGRVLKWIASLLDAAPNPRLHPGTGALSPAQGGATEGGTLAPFFVPRGFFWGTANAKGRVNKCGSIAW